MIAKKNSRYDLESKRSAFFTLGLFVTGSLTLAAFTYSDPIARADERKNVTAELVQINWDVNDEPVKEKSQDMPKVQIERTEEPSTVAATGAVSEVITTVSNTSTTIDPNAGVDLNGLPSGPITKIGGGLIVIDQDKIFDEIIDKDAEYVGGYAELQKFISTEVKYPQVSIETGEEGKVYLSFVVEKDGSISNVVVERGVSNDLDREAKRVIHSFPNWIPGEVKLQKVRTRVRLPINFVLSK